MKKHLRLPKSLVPVMRRDRELRHPATPPRLSIPRPHSRPLGRAEFFTKQHRFGCIFPSFSCAAVVQLWARCWVLFWSFWAALGAQRT